MTRKLYFINIFMILTFCLAHMTLTHPATSYGQQKEVSEKASSETIYEADDSTPSIFARAWEGGIIVFMVLLILIVLSILSWAVGIAKLLYLNKLSSTGKVFIKSFWDSRSLNSLNGRLSEYPYSPIKEVFRSGYAELVRGSQMREQAGTNTQLVMNAAVDNLTRSLAKAKMAEKQKMERLLSFLAITASTGPFIGLFGTVWGIMGAFESIARSGSASLAAVAPGISEALIATAFGLAAAIPAVVGYNMANARIRALLNQVDGFSADFLNIVERYLVSDKAKPNSGSGASHHAEQL